MIPGLLPEEARDLLLSVGIQNPRRQLSPVEVGEYIQRALDAGATSQELAEKCSLKGDSMIGRFTKLLDLAPELSHLVIFGTDGDSLSSTQALELIAVGDHETQLRVADYVLRHSLSKDEIRAVRQRIQRSDIGLAAAVERILALRPEAIESWLIVGLVKEDNQAKLRALTQAQRDAVFARLLSSLGLEGSGHLGVNRFTILTQDEDTGSIDVDEFESGVNRLLADSSFQ